MTAFVISRTQLLRMEKWHASRLRVLLLGEAPGLTHKQVRIICDAPSVYAFLLRGRFRFLQKLARNPTQHEAILAALAGNLKGGKQQLKGVNIADDCNPWLRQYWQDIEIAASIDATL